MAQVQVPEKIAVLQSKAVPNPAPPASDPKVYQQHHDAFAAEGLPKTPEAWLERAKKVSDILAVDAAVRNKEQKTPRAEVALLKSSGLTKILGDPKYGGGGQNWDTALKAVRQVAIGDGSIGMLLGYHLMWSRIAAIVGTEEQRERYEKLINENNYYVGGAVNPRDNDSVIAQAGDKLVLNGFKNFTTGAAVSDLVVLEGVYEGTEEHIFALVPTNQPGIVFLNNWNNMGLRLTESGAAKLMQINFPWEDALGWNAETKTPIKELTSGPFSTIMVPMIQLVFANFYIGIAYGALRTGAEYTKTQTRAWPFSHDPKKSPLEEHYILARYGKSYAALQAAEALADKGGAELAALFTAHGVTRDITERQRGVLAELVTALKIVATHNCLEVTSSIFEVTGSRSTSERYAFDRFWKDIRTHTLHDPVAYKETELGRYYLLDEIPKPSWYT